MPFPNFTSGIGAIYMVRDDFFIGQILFDDHLIPVQYYRCASDHFDVLSTMIRDFPVLEMKGEPEFRSELDHIKLFGVRSSAPCIELPTTEDLVPIFEPEIDDYPLRHDVEKRLTNDDISGILDESNMVLDGFDFDKIRKHSDALRPTSNMEDRPERPK